MATRAGELNTRIIIEKRVETQNEYLEVVDEWVNVFGEGVTLAAKWRGSRRTADLVSDDRISAPEEALVSIRYVRGVTASCRVKRVGDETEVPWMIVASPIRNTNSGFLEFTVRRKVAAL